MNVLTNSECVYIYNRFETLSYIITLFMTSLSAYTRVCFFYFSQVFSSEGPSPRSINKQQKLYPLAKQYKQIRCFEQRHFVGIISQRRAFVPPMFFAPFFNIDACARGGINVDMWLCFMLRYKQTRRKYKVRISEFKADDRLLITQRRSVFCDIVASQTGNDRFCVMHLFWHRFPWSSLGREA